MAEVSSGSQTVRITVDEAAVLQGFPANYPWPGSRSRCFLQVGNAVCPPVARLIATAAARRSLKGKGGG